MASTKKISFIQNTVAAGFPNPRSEFIVSPISIDDLLIKRPSSTFLIRVNGLSMYPTIPNGALLVVDKSITARNDSIVVALVHNEFIVKQLKLPKDGPPILHSHNKEFSDVVINEENQDMTEIWGCVTASIKQF